MRHHQRNPATEHSDNGRKNWATMSGKWICGSKSLIEID
jgi:hypothetical protein